jgi:hypothetical protein
MGKRKRKTKQVEEVVEQVQPIVTETKVEEVVGDVELIDKIDEVIETVIISEDKVTEKDPKEIVKDTLKDEQIELKEEGKTLPEIKEKIVIPTPKGESKPKVPVQFMRPFIKQR